MTKVVGDILTEEEVKAMIEACENSRDRALIATIYDGGFRVGEIGTLTWGRVTFDDYGALVNVDEKTGKPRHVRLIMAAPYLATWRSDYPGDATGDAPVFLTIRRESFSYDGLQRQIKRIAYRADIRKHVSTHLFRHSRITHLIQNGVPDSAIKLMMWGSLTTDMFAAYAHLTGQDIDNAMIAAAGVKRSEEKEKKRILEPRQCGRCYTLNGPTADYCGRCGQPLT